MVSGNLFSIPFLLLIANIMKIPFFLLIVLLFSSCEDGRKEGVIWSINTTNQIGGNPTTSWGNPKVISGEEGNVVEFDGQKDGLLVDDNPIAEEEQFTIEVDFKPYEGFPENREQRFLHIQDPENEDRRILIELRLNDRGEWFGDWYIKAEDQSLALIDSTLTHPVGEWATISMEYKDGLLKGFVNGQEEVSGKINYLPIGEKAKTSIGTRMDKRSWFKGAIEEVRFFSEASDHE